MRRSIIVLLASLTAAVALSLPGPAQSQTRALTEPECKAARDRLTEHARLSDGVRRDLAGRTAGLPAAPPAAAPAAPAAAPAAQAPVAGRAETIRARLEKIPAERQSLEDTRLASYLRMDFGKASQMAQQIAALDAEKAGLEKELAGLPAIPAGAPSAPAAPPAVAPPAPVATSPADRLSCQDVPAALDAAVKIRQRELGAKEGQPGVVPLAALKGQSPDQIAQELAAQFAAWPEAAAQVGLLDQEGDGRLDAFVDAPVPNVFRLYRQRPDGTVSVEAFRVPGASGDSAYGDIPRRIEETTVRQTGRTLGDLLAARPAGPVRLMGETGDFRTAQAAFFAGNFADAAKVEGGGARTMEFQNHRGETLRVMESIAPATGGVAARRFVAWSRPNNEELWEEMTTMVRPTSYYRTDVEVRAATERRSTAGASLAPRSPAGPWSFGLDR